MSKLSISTIRQDKDLRPYFYNDKCDKYDYLVAVGCGAIAGMVDIFLVGSPADSRLQCWTDAQVDKTVMVFAKTSKAASRLSEQIRLHKIEKYYLAVVNGKVESATYKDKILREEYQSKIDKNGKEAVLSFETLKVINNTSLVKINLLTGRHHQIRVQFSSRGHSLLGDNRYGKKEKYPLALYAYHLAFYHPVTKEKLIFENLPTEGYFQNLDISRLLT